VVRYGPETPDAGPNYRVMEEYARLPLPERPASTPRLSKTDSVLLVRLSAIGDVVRGLPLVKYLRSNGFEGFLGWAVQPPCDELLEAWPGIDRVHRLDRERWWAHPRRLIRQLRNLREPGYDWCFDWHGLLKSGVVSRASGAEHRIGFHKSNVKEASHWLQDGTISALPNSMPRMLKYLQLLRAFTPDYGATRERLRPEPPAFEPDDRAPREAAGDRPILLHPRTSRTRYGRRKEWGTDNFRTLIERLREEESKLEVWVTWGPGERASAEEIARGFDEGVRPAPATPGLTDLCSLIQRARLVVSGDTAPCHLADVLGTPLVALFGSSDHRVSGPLLTDYRLITTGTGETGTGQIPVDRVWRAVWDLLDTAG